MQSRSHPRQFGYHYWDQHDGFVRHGPFIHWVIDCWLDRHKRFAQYVWQHYRHWNGVNFHRIDGHGNHGLEFHERNIWFIGRLE